MKKALGILIALSLFLPAGVWAKGETLKEKFNIGNVEHSAIIENGSVLSTTATLTMRDGNEFVIPVTIDKKTYTATFAFASGKTVTLSPLGMKVTKGDGYQDYDDIANTVDFIETYDTTTCILNIICFLIIPYPLDLIFVYFIYLTCF